MNDWAVSGGGDSGAAVPDARVRRGALARWGALAAAVVLAAGAVPAGAQSTDPPAADDASLSSLSLSGVDFGGFSGEVLVYAANVAGDVSATTVTATATNSSAEVSILPTDADADTDGHQVSLAPGRNWVRVSVGSADATVAQQYTVVVVRDPGPAMTRNTDKDIAYAYGSEEFTTNPDYDWSEGGGPFTGMLWGEGTTLWMSDGRHLLAYDLESGLAQGDLHYPVAGMPRDMINGLWSDGTTMWASPGHHFSEVIAHELGTGKRTGDADLDTGLCCEPQLRGLWSDGETMWVVEKDSQDLLAIGLEDGERRHDSDIDLGDIDHAAGLWSDGKTIWVTASRGPFGEAEYGEIRAYDLESGERVPELGFGELDYMWRTTGIWSDGATMWAAEGRWGTQIWAFNMPQSGLLSWLDVSDAHVPFAADRFEYSVQVPLGVSRVTLSAAAAFSDSEVSFSVADADSDVGGVQVDLVEGLNTVVVTSVNGDDTRTYTLRIDAGAPPPPLPPPLGTELSSLAVSGVELTFSADRLTYAAEVAADVESVTVSAVAADERASVTVLPADADPVADAHQVSLSVGANVVTVTVVVGEVMRTYTVLLTRPAGTSDDSTDSDEAVGGESDGEGNDDSDEAVGGESDGEGPVSLQQEEAEELVAAEQRSESGSESDGSDGSGLPALTASFEELPDAHSGAGTDLVVRARFSEPLAVSYVTMRDGGAVFVQSPHRVVKAKRVEGRSDLWDITIRVGDDRRLSVTVFKGSGCDGEHAVCTADGRPVSQAAQVFIEGPDTSDDSGDGAEGSSGSEASDADGEQQDGEQQDGEQQAPEQQAPEARAGNEIGAVTLSSEAPGELTVSWEAPRLAPYGYRVMWARDDLDYLSYWQPDETNRGNLWPTGDATSVTLTGLDEGATYKVQTRARFHDVQGKVSSSPWTTETTATVAHIR
ncbi:cadherin-like beta sandwich domain-containing protein [Candidatus Poriferisodalis sp.]|uniref:cadherin-like beta sandwich domain-containing protein n=1 Tax=Candidatus Poriferisodalis sp. TaxID=3101277 RepID=UPI003B01F189